MKKNSIFIFLVLFIFPVAILAQDKKNNPEERLKELNIQLITPSAPVANYVKVVHIGNMLYLSGHGPDKAGGGLVTGKVGVDLTLEQAKDAARLVGISLLSTIKAEL